MSSVRDKIVGYLAAGVSQTLAAEAAGVSDSYVSQLLELDDVREEIAAKKSKKLERHIEVDTTIEEVEKDALKVVAAKVKFSNAREAAQIFSIMNAARKKADLGANPGGTGNVDTVVFVLPKAAKTMIQINSDNQVIEVDGKTTAPLPSKALPQMQKRLELAKTVELPHITEIKEKAQVADQSRAQSILKDVVTVIDGVQVVI